MQKTHRVFFFNIMTNLCRNHKKYVNKNVHYEPTIFECDKVNIGKFNTLFHGPYVVVDASEQSMYKQKKIVFENNRFEVILLELA